MEISSNRATPLASVVAERGEIEFPEPVAETSTTMPESVVPSASRTSTRMMLRPVFTVIVAGSAVTRLAEALGPAGGGGGGGGAGGGGGGGGEGGD